MIRWLNAYEEYMESLAFGCWRIKGSSVWVFWMEEWFVETECSVDFFRLRCRCIVQLCLL